MDQVEAPLKSRETALVPPAQDGWTKLSPKWPGCALTHAIPCPFSQPLPNDHAS